MTEGDANSLADRWTKVSAIPPPAPNRLSIAHLLLWTATTAVAIGTIMPESRSAPFPEDMPAEFREYRQREDQQWRIATVLASPVLGAGLAGLAIAGWRRSRGEDGFPLYPGHWILMIVGAGTLAFMELRLFDRLEPLPFPAGHIPLMLVFWATFALSLVLLVVAYFRTSDPLRWKYVFAIAGGNIALFFFGGCCAFPMGVPGPAQLVVLTILYATPISMLVAAGLDLRSGRAYDVFHWAGVLTLPALAVLLTALALLG